MTIYADLAAAIRAEQPVALVTVIDGPNTGAKLLVRRDAEPVGELGHPELDRVAFRGLVAGRPR